MTEISDWIYRLERYRLLGSRCVECGDITYPYRRRCVKCGSETERFELPRRGKLVYFTMVKSLPERFNRYGSYYIGVVELENGVRVLGMLTDIDKPFRGMEVEATLRKLYVYGRDGKIIYGLKFRPVIR